MADEPKKIKLGMWWTMIGVALLFDVIKWLLLLIPVAGEVLGDLADIPFFAIFWLWFKIEGSSYSKNTLVIGAIFGAIPVIGEIIPEWTLAIVKLYFEAKAQKVIAVVPGGQMAEKTVAQKNQNGVQNKPGGQVNQPAQRSNTLPINSKQNNMTERKNTQPQFDPLEKEHAKIKEDNERKYREGTKDPTQAYREEMNKFYGRETPKENKPDMEEVMRKDEEKRKAERDRKWEEGTRYTREFRGGKGLVDEN